MPPPGKSNRGSFIDVIAILLGAFGVTLFIFGLAAALDEHPLNLDFLGRFAPMLGGGWKWLVAGTGTASLLSWLFGGNVGVREYLGWTLSISAGLIAAVFAVIALRPKPPIPIPAPPLKPAIKKIINLGFTNGDLVFGKNVHGPSGMGTADSPWYWELQIGSALDPKCPPDLSRTATIQFGNPIGFVDWARWKPIGNSWSLIFNVPLNDAPNPDQRPAWFGNGRMTVSWWSNAPDCPPDN